MTVKTFHGQRRVDLRQSVKCPACSRLHDQVILLSRRLRRHGLDLLGFLLHRHQKIHFHLNYSVHHKVLNLFLYRQDLQLNLSRLV